MKANVLMFSDYGYPAYATTISYMDKTVKEREKGSRRFRARFGRGLEDPCRGGHPRPSCGGRDVQAETVEAAIRGGATGSEVLGRLSEALPRAVSSETRTQAELDAPAAWVTEQVRPSP